MEKVLPKGWVETPIENLFNLVYGKGISTKDLLNSDYNGDLYDVYGANGIIGKFSNYSYKNSKVIISCRGAASGKIHKTNPYSFISSNSIILDEVSEALLNLDFVKYVMTIAEKSAIITGTAQPQITIQFLKDLQIPLPPLAEQERIVAKLDKLFAQHDKIKAALDRIPQLLKNFRQQLLTQAVTGKLNKVSVLENKLVSDFFEVKTGATPKKGFSKYYQDATIPWIKSGEVKNTFIHDVDEFISEIAVKETNAKVFPIDTILVAMYGEGKTRGQVGWMKIEAATNQAIAALVNENLNEWTRRYIYLFCISQYNEIRAKAEGGNQPNLNLSKIKNWEISIPQKASEQQEIVLQVESLFAKADAIEARYQTLKAKIESLPQAILHKAFKGELVPQLPTDGDAKDLLAEIIKLKKEAKTKGKRVNK